MQVEYEEPQVANGSMPFRQMPPPASDPPVEDEDGSEPEEEEQQDEGAGGKKPKQKRIIKPRQSLSDKQTGTTIFPISRVKRIIKADKELDMMTGEACFMVAVATEYFIQHFMEEGYTKARLEKRKIVNYKDLAAVVSRNEEFDFLRDIIPEPIPISEALERRKQKILNDDNPTLHEDGVIAAPQILVDDNLPPLIPSTNPLYPNAIVKKPPNTHAKTSMKPKDAKKDEGPVPAGTAAGLASPKVATGKNVPSVPHPLSTRRSARHSLAAADADAQGNVDMEALAGEGEGRHGDIEMANDVRAIATGEVPPHVIQGADAGAMEALVPPPAAITAEERMDED